jgi:outer membrane protein OmpA-like peptidoglycan-associated protein
VTYRAQDADGNVVESTLDLQVSALRVTAGTDVVYPAQTGHARLHGVPAGASVTPQQPVPGASEVTYSDGQIHAVSTARFTGRIQVPVTIVNGTATIHLTVVITVRPHAPTGIRFRAADGGDTVITWNRSAGPEPEAYQVRVAGHLLCRTGTRSCTVKHMVVGPGTAVTVVGVGGERVTSPSARGVYRPQGCASIGAVYFGTDSAALGKRAKHELDRLAGILRPQGFTRACLVGHTDNSAGSDYNLRLSQRRVSAVAAYLHARARRVRYTSSHVGEKDPARPNTTTHNKAANRRVEIGVA